MIINAVFDSSTTGAPAGFFTAVNAAVAYWESEITNPLTVTISFGYNEVDGLTIGSSALAESESEGINVSYAQLKAGLASAATTVNDQTAVAHLPTTDPTNGVGYFVPIAEAEALGLFGATNQTVGYVGLSSAFPFTFDPNNRSVAGDFDAVGALEHEISEVLGRIASSGAIVSGHTEYSPLDLFRYASAGVLALTPEGASFSIDGTHLLLPFNNPNGGNDAGDWATSVLGDSFGEGSQGLAGLVSATDLEVMDVLGFTIAPTVRDDFNGDAKADILWRNTNGDVSVWLSNASGSFTYPDLGVVGSAWSVQGVGDFNGDGKADILWRNTNGDTSIWMSNGSGGFTYPDLGVVGSAWSVQGVGDFNGDGKSDILWRNTNGDVSVWLSNASGSFTYPDLGVVGSAWSIQGVGDFNGDGKSDILWRNTNGDTSIWLSNASGGFTYPDLGVIGSAWSVQGVGDFNGDGKSDILWRNTNGDTSIWLSNGSGGFTYSDLGVIGSAWSIQGVGDFNGDGKADILWRNTNGDTSIWLSNAGAGYTGFTSHDEGMVGTDWTIVGESPPSLGSVPGAQTVTSAAPISAATASPSSPPPSLTNVGAAASYHAGGAAVDVAHALAITDPGSTTLASATVAIAAGLLAGDLLSVASQDGISSSYNASSGVLTLTGVASLADYQHALDSVAFASSASDPTNGGADTWRTLAISIDDGAHVSNSIETGLTIADPFLANLNVHSTVLFG